ncbi:MAG: CvpA family protein [Oscillospiraceae bacterium]|jgi:hypothetical protein|nr:CvpA family protein [Oscillospiraceae bacterium]
MAEPIQVDFSGKDKSKPEAPAYIPPDRPGLKIGLALLGSVITAFVAYYIMVPAINLKDQQFYLYLGIVVASFFVFLSILSGAAKDPAYMPWVRRQCTVPFILLGVIVLFFGLNWVFSSPFFHAREYAAIMQVNRDADFKADVEEPDINQIPKLDENAATAVANKTLGDLADVVSQFTLSGTNTQINYKTKPVRVVTLQYQNAIKWLFNTKDGLPGYVVVDMASEKSTFQRLPERIKYSDAEHFNELIKRHLRFQYLGWLLGEAVFEVDDSGHPYWIAPVMDMKVGLLGGQDIVGIILCDAVTGESKDYSMEKVANDPSLQWIDRVYSASLLQTQYDWYGKYEGGFWNSLLGQKNVTKVTAVYNYLAKDDDVFYYTGVSSVTTDESIIGFLLVNQRTKATTFYRVNGATEQAAMNTAQGLVSDMGWTATAPLLINYGGQPTYFLSLKDAQNVVQGYSMINVTEYNKIKVNATKVSSVVTAYSQALADNGVELSAAEVPVTDEPGQTEPEEPAAQTDEIQVQTAVIGGKTIQYVVIDGETYIKVNP